MKGAHFSEDKSSKDRAFRKGKTKKHFFLNLAHLGMTLQEDHDRAMRGKCGVEVGTLRIYTIVAALAVTNSAAPFPTAASAAAIFVFLSAISAVAAVGVRFKPFAATQTNSGSSFLRIFRRRQGVPGPQRLTVMSRELQSSSKRQASEHRVHSYVHSS